MFLGKKEASPSRSMSMSTCGMLHRHLGPIGSKNPAISPESPDSGYHSGKSLRVSSDFHRAEVLKIFATAFSSVSGLVGGSRFTMD